MKINRVFLIVMDSFGAGAQPDAPAFGDAGSNTLASVAKSPFFCAPHLLQLGLFSLNGNPDWMHKKAPSNLWGCFGKMQEQSAGKDTTMGHWEMAGLISKRPMPTYPNGFPDEIVRKLEQETGHSFLLNRPYSGTQAILDYGRQHLKTGALILYTSQDSVMQIAAHEQKIPLEELYQCCRIARKIMQGENGVGRIIARPFVGEFPNFVRTSNRHDFSLAPPGETMLNVLQNAGLSTIAVGKINDIFAGSGITRAIKTKNNADGMRVFSEMIEESFSGLCFINLVDFDMLYGHRNDPDGYAKAVSQMDQALGKSLSALKEKDLLIITADHGCDPCTKSTDHSREYVPLLLYGKALLPGVNLGIRSSFADLAASVLDLFSLQGKIAGKSFASQLLWRNC